MSEQLPRPPRILDHLVADDVRVLGAGTALTRVFFTAGAHPSRWNTMRNFGPTRARFDHHPEPAQAHPKGPATAHWAAPGTETPVASNPFAATLAEVFAENRTVDLRTETPFIVVMETTRDLRLLDVSDSVWVTRNHGNAAISSGSRATARAWARLIHSTYLDLDGIWYQTSTYPPGRSVVLNERAADAYPSRPQLSGSLEDPKLVAAVRASAVEIGYKVL